MSLLEDSGVTPTLAKSELYTSSNTYLRHFITSSHLKKASHTPNGIRDWSPATTVPELIPFLGLYNVFGQFAPNFPHIVAALNETLRRRPTKGLAQLTAEETTAMKVLQDKLVSPPVFVLPRCIGGCSLNTDACNVRVVCLLIQEQENRTYRQMDTGRSLWMTQRTPMIQHTVIFTKYCSQFCCSGAIWKAPRLLYVPILTSWNGFAPRRCF